VLPPASPGHVTNNVHPGDPVQQVAVAGFATVQEALQFVEAGLGDAPKPLFAAKLAREQTASFAGASFLVFFWEQDGKPTLFALARCHADLHLVIGSCGYQFQLGVNTTAAATQHQYLQR
jgi:hypothetical protein